MNKLTHSIRVVLSLFICLMPAVVDGQVKARTSNRPAQPWRAVHLLNYNTDSELEALGQNLEELARQGINTIILEVDYNFAFKSHPELRRGVNPITFAGARRFAALCKKLNIRLIPEFQSVGHQSWKQETFPLLTVYPKFDLTPGAYPNNDGLYCREWDILNPAVWRVVFQLMDEIIYAFRADALHVGMDEVFLLGSEQSPSTKGKDPGKLFAQAVNEIHKHLVGKRRVEMLMWGDRLIDGKKFDLGEWEAATNGTAAAIDLIPKDIIICPWHYELRDSYASIPMFIEKGFRVLPAGWKNLDATKALIQFSRSHSGPKLLGYMFTTWGVKKEELVGFPPLVEGLKLLQQQPQPATTRELEFEVKHRVNAHGDEFNGLARSSDGQRLFVATEKGDIIVWNIAASRVEQTFHNPAPLHFVGSLADPNEVVVAGSYHPAPYRALVRKWNIETGSFTDLTGIDTDSFPIAIANDNTENLIALSTAERLVVVWDAKTNKQLAEWKLPTVPLALALLGRSLYVATVNADVRSPYDKPKDSAIIKLSIDDPKQAPANFLRVPNRLWSDLDVSPDRRLLSATYHAAGEGQRTVVIDLATKKEIGKFEDLLAWIDSSKIMLFEWLDPSEIVEVSTKQPAKRIYKFARMEADTPGRAFSMTGRVTNADGSKVWASYDKGGALLEFDRASNKIKTLIGGPTGAYGLSVNESAGEILTGGADGYVRLWRFEDLSLVKEFKIAKAGYYVSDALLVPGSRAAVVGVREARQPSRERPFAPLEVIRVDLDSGEQKKLFAVNSAILRLAVVGNEIVYAEEDRVKLTSVDGASTRELKVAGPVFLTAVSGNGRWLAAAYPNGLTVVDLEALRAKTVTSFIVDLPIVITNDGRYIYTIGHEGALARWDTVTSMRTDSILDRVREMHSNVDFMALANNDEWLLTAGNHGDAGVFDRATGRLVSYARAPAAAFYAEKVWTNGTRMLITTDTGVMYSGILK